ncbi:DUF3027 domain-containing protein [Microbacterium sp. 2C]|uniref:DUF3027 domain-containing protein n=1 Tax=Microbacterium paulum TaxID=2707006 RepID=UPI0018C32202|nr:DUF3027 domain-containing protein [Microbacterium paulum]MBG0717469.1 DUF3027 domain-containing protein [Microbacterium paulum]
MTSTPEHETPEHETPENETAEIDLSAAAEVAVDARLIEAHDLALAALHEITPASTVGAPAGYTLEDDGAVSLRFANTMPGYPNWFWTVSVAAVEGAEPTVLEAELLPGEGALLAPEWVPWAERLAEYQAAQAALAAEQGDAEASDALDDTDEADDVDDLDDLDAADFDEDGSPILHAGDVDGVDIDELDEDAEDDDDEDDDDEDDDDEDDDDEAGDDDEDAEDEADED